MDCHAAQERLAEDAGAAAQDPAVRRHLDGCPECRAVAAGFVQTVARLARAAPAPPDEAAFVRIRAGVLRRLPSPSGRAASREDGPVGRPEAARQKRVGVRAAAAVFVVAATLAWAVGTTRLPEDGSKAAIRIARETARAPAATAAARHRPRNLGRVEWTHRAEERGITVHWVFDPELEFSLEGTRKEIR